MIRPMHGPARTHILDGPVHGVRQAVEAASGFDPGAYATFERLLSTSQAGLTGGQTVATVPELEGGANLTTIGGSNEALHVADGDLLDFDGVDDAYDAATKTPYNFLHQGENTVAWVMDLESDVSGLQALWYTGLDAPGGVLVYVRVGQLNVILSNNTARIAQGASSTALLTNTRHVVIQTITASSIQWWVDGVSAGSIPVTGPFGDLDSEFVLRLGRFGTSWAQGAKMGSFHMWSGAVTASESIAAITAHLGGL